MAGEYDWIGQLLTGGYNLATSGQDMNDAERASRMADPWADRRGQFGDQLAGYMQNNAINPGAATARSDQALSRLTGLLQNPGSLTSMPGYQFGLNQALEGVNRGAGASGMLNSGNRLAALQDRGQGYAQGWQNQIYNQLLGGVNAATGVDALGLNAQQQGFGQLAGLAGVNAGSPVAAAQALLSGRQNQSNSIGTGIGGVTNGVTGLLGSLPAIQRALGLGGSGGGWAGATPGGANGSWDVSGLDGSGGTNWGDVWGENSGWGQDLLGGGLDNFDPFGISGW